MSTLARAVSSISADAIVSSRVRAVGAAFFRFRAGLVPPAALLAWTFARAHQTPPAQLRAMGVGMTVTSAFFLYEALRATREPLTERRFAASLLVTLAALALAAAVTGAINSPMLPLLFAPTVTAFAALGRARRARYALFAALVAVVALLAALPDGTPFAPLPQQTRAPLAALFTLVTAALLWSSVAGLADAYALAAREVDRLREDAVARLEERARTVDSVGAKVAHEIKNPLAAIKGLAQLMAREERPEREARRLDVILGEVTRMESVLAEYLTFARPLDALSLEDVSLADLVNGALATLEPRALRAGVSLGCEGASITLRCDRRKLEAALINLALNAIEATPTGGSVRVRWARATDGTTTLTVEDTGRGLDERARAKIGTPFFSTREGGTGLGVVLARTAVEQHGGTLTFSPISSGGTMVTLTLPSAS
jgi:signal transduction histidine kinase